MAILPILEVPDPRLKTISTPVETFDADLKTLVDDMTETMYAAPGIGLAAIPAIRQAIKSYRAKKAIADVLVDSLEAAIDEIDHKK